MEPKWKREIQANHSIWWRTTYCWIYGAVGHVGEEWNNKSQGHKSKANVTTRSGGIIFGLPQVLCLLGSNTGTLNVTNNEINLESLENFIQTKNTCSVHPPTCLEQYGISNTGATQNYIRVNNYVATISQLQTVPKSSYLKAASCNPPIDHN